MNYYNIIMIPVGMLMAAVLSDAEFKFIFSITTIAIAIHWFIYDSVCHDGDCRYSIMYLGIVIFGSWKAQNKYVPKRLTPNGQVLESEQVGQFRQACSYTVRRTKYMDTWQARFRDAVEQHMGNESFELTIEHHQPGEAYFEEEFIQSKMLEGWTVLVIERPQGATKYRFS